MDRIIKDIGLLLGGWTIIVTGLVTWISSLVSRRIINSWDTKNQIALSELRHNQAEIQLSLQELSSGIVANQSILQTRRVEAIDKLWSVIKEMKDYSSLVTTFFAIFTPNEYSKISQTPYAQKVDDAHFDKFLSLSKDLEIQRPYLGETLWLLFFMYRAFLGRLEFLILELKGGKVITDWREEGTLQQMKRVFTKDEFTTLLKLNPLEVNYAINIFESKLLGEISQILSGRKSLLESYENSKELKKLLEKDNLQ